MLLYIAIYLLSTFVLMVGVGKLLKRGRLRGGTEGWHDEWTT